MIYIKDPSSIPTALLCMCCYQVCDIPFTCEKCKNLICCICLFQASNKCLICKGWKFYKTDPIILQVLLKIKCQCQFCEQTKSYLKFNNHNHICEILSDNQRLETYFKKSQQFNYENCKGCGQLLTMPFKCNECQKAYCQNCFNQLKEKSKIFKCKDESIQCAIVKTEKQNITKYYNPLTCNYCQETVCQFSLGKHYKKCLLKFRYEKIFPDNEEMIQKFGFPQVIFLQTQFLRDYQQAKYLKQKKDTTRLSQISIDFEKHTMRQYDQWLINQQKFINDQKQQEDY